MGVAEPETSATPGPELPTAGRRKPKRGGPDSGHPVAARPRSETVYFRVSGEGQDAATRANKGRPATLAERRAGARQDDLQEIPERRQNASEWDQGHG